MEEFLQKDNAEEQPQAEKEETPVPGLFKQKTKKKGGILADIKRRFSSYGPDKAKSRAVDYDESFLTRTAYFTHLVMVFSGRVTRQLMESYKRVFDFPQEDSADIYTNLGIDFLQKFEYKQAIAAFKKSLDLYPDKKEVFYYLANTYLKVKNYKDAISSYMVTLRYEPTNADAYFEIGVCYAGLEKYQDAIDNYKRAAELDPDNEEIYYCLGVSFDQVKRYNNAIACFKKAIDLNPRVARFYHSLGFTYECEKQHDKAIECFKKAIQLERE